MDMDMSPLRPQNYLFGNCWGVGARPSRACRLWWGGGIPLRPGLARKAKQAGGLREWEASRWGPAAYRMGTQEGRAGSTEGGGKEGRPEGWGVSGPRPRA